MTVRSVVIGALGTIPLSLAKRSRRVRNQKNCGDHPDYSNIMIKQNTEKSHVDLRSLAVAQTPVKNCLLTIVPKNFKGVK